MRFEASASRRCALLCAAIAAFFIATPALAHDPPQGTGVLVHDGAVLVRSNRGLILRSAGEADFKLLCNEALSINTAEVPALLARADGSWLVGTSRGLSIVTPDLCTFKPNAVLDAVAVPALARDPLDSLRILASTGQAGFDNGLFQSSDDGATFATYGSRDANRMFDHLAVSAANEATVAASGLRLAAGASSFTHFFAVSSDSGKSFTEHAFELTSDEYAIELLALHPLQKDTLFAAVHANLGTGVKDRVLVSRDGAATFETVHEVDKLTGLVVDSTGQRVHIGARDGLWLSVDGGATFERIQTRPVHCLAQHDGILYVCDDQPDGSGVSTSTDDGRTLTSLVRFPQVTSQVDCGVTSQAQASCAGPWLDWLREQRDGFGADAGGLHSDASMGAADGGTVPEPTDAGSTASKKESSSGCMVASLSPIGVSAWRGSVVGMLLLALVARLRFRCRTRGSGVAPS